MASKVEILPEVSARFLRSTAFWSKRNPITGKVMLLGLVLMGLLGLPLSMAIDDGSFVTDYGIGLLGLYQPGSGSPKSHVEGIPEAKPFLPVQLQGALQGIALKQKPHSQSKTVATLDYTPEGLLAWRHQDTLYTLRESGIILQPKQAAFIVVSQGGPWLEVLINQAPRLTGWLDMRKHHRVLRFWLWYYYIRESVQKNLPLVFIYAKDAEFRSGPSINSIALPRGIFDPESAVLDPLMLQDGYLLVRQRPPQSCDPLFAQGALVHSQPQDTKAAEEGWVRWINNQGRPTMMRAIPPACSN